MLPSKQSIFNALENKDTTKTESFMSGFLSLLIIGNVGAMILSTIPSLSHMDTYFNMFEIFSICIFILEYIARIWTAPLHPQFTSRWKYICSPLMIFDALVIIPGIISLVFPGVLDGRILKIIRVFRILRLKKYSESINNMFSIIHQHKNDLVSAFLLIFMGVIIASTVMYYAEKDVQPEHFGSIPDALYWGFITLSTIGYGDVAPVSVIGKIIATLTALVGVSIYALPTSILGAAFYAELQSKEAHRVLTLERQVSKLKKQLVAMRMEEEEKKESNESPTISLSPPKKKWWQKIIYSKKT